MNRLTQLNNLIKRIKSEGYTFQTEHKYIQQSFARIVIPSGVKNSGFIRTKEETNAELKKRYGDKAILFTDKTYNEELKSLVKSLDSTSYKTFKKNLRDDLIDIIENMNDELDIEYKYEQKSTEDLYNAVKAANEASKADSKGSPSFYEHLAEALGITE